MRTIAEDTTRCLRMLVPVSGADGNAPGGSALTVRTEMQNGSCCSRCLDYFAYGNGGKRRLGWTVDLSATGAIKHPRPRGFGTPTGALSYNEATGTRC